MAHFGMKRKISKKAVIGAVKSKKTPKHLKLGLKKKFAKWLKGKV